MITFSAANRSTNSRRFTASDTACVIRCRARNHWRTSSVMLRFEMHARKIARGKVLQVWEMVRHRMEARSRSPPD
jgi:hypothetical protein